MRVNGFVSIEEYPFSVGFLINKFGDSPTQLELSPKPDNSVKYIETAVLILARKSKENLISLFISDKFRPLNENENLKPLPVSILTRFGFS